MQSSGRIGVELLLSAWEGERIKILCKVELLDEKMKIMFTVVAISWLVVAIAWMIEYDRVTELQDEVETLQLALNAFDDIQKTVVVRDTVYVADPAQIRLCLDAYQWLRENRNYTPEKAMTLTINWWRKKQ